MSEKVGLKQQLDAWRHLGIHTEETLSLLDAFEKMLVEAAKDLPDPKDKKYFKTWHFPPLPDTFDHEAYSMAMQDWREKYFAGLEASR